MSERAIVRGAYGACNEIEIGRTPAGAAGRGDPLVHDVYPCGNPGRDRQQ